MKRRQSRAGLVREVHSVPSVRQGPLPSSRALAYLNDLVAPHVQSFNGFLDSGLPAIVRALPTHHVTLASGDRLSFWLEDATIERPSVGPGEGIADPRLLPAECRERGETYGGELSVCLVRRVNDDEPIRARHNLGRVPVMLRSARCHLEGMSPSQLVAVGEEAVECGGYFIVNGVDKIIRMLQIPKRNYPMAIRRGAYCKRGPLYTDKGIALRCVRPSDQSSVTLTLHYLADGSTTARFAVRKQEFFLPVVLLLKALVQTSDREIYERILGGNTGNTHLSDRLLLLLRGAKSYGRALVSQQSTLTYLGERFRSVLPDLPPGASDVQVGEALLRGYVLVHIEREDGGGRDKFNLLILMLRKLYAFVAGDVMEDNADSLAHQEVLLGGTLLQVFMKEKLEEYLEGIEASIRVDEKAASSRAAAAAAAVAAAEAAAAEAAAAAGSSSSDSEEGEEEEEGRGSSSSSRSAARRASSASSSSAAAAAAAAASLAPASARQAPRSQGRAPALFDPRDNGKWRAYVARQASIGRKLCYFLATGNLVSSTGLDLMQVSGYSVVADKINFIRFTTHFRSIHRGQFFTTMKTTTVRKLLPESWGFLCPVHTPDGGPCGLLNHFARPCSIAAMPLDAASFGDLARACAAADAGADGSQEGEEDMGSSSSSSSSSGAAVALLQPALAAPQLSPAASIAALLLALGMTPHAAEGTILHVQHLPIMLDGIVLGGAAPHVVHRIVAALRTAKALAGGISGSVAGMAEEDLQPRGVAQEREAVAGLMRCAVSGRCFAGGSGAAAAAAATASAAAESNPATLPPRGLPSFGALGCVPPSLEVAFIPPPWWDTAIDPFLVPDSSEATHRALSWSFLLASSTASSSTGEAGGEAAAAAAAAAASATPGSASPTTPQKLTGLFPGLFLATAPSRPLRPVLQLDTGLVELLSPLEQLALDIAVMPEDAGQILSNSSSGSGSSSSSSPTAAYTHCELSATAMLSEVASLTPFSDQNQSPRNMYQCQMAKQTMGTPAHALGHRCDAKLHRLLTPQAPIVQNAAQAEFGFDEYPNGANACVAVLSYTGFDMEDACIINKSSFERGWGWAAVYKCYTVDLNEHRTAGDSGRYLLHNTYLKGEPRCADAAGSVSAAGAAAAAPAASLSASAPAAGELVCPDLDADGLPPIGALIRPGAPLYCYLDSSSQKHSVVKHKEGEAGYVEEVRLMPTKAQVAGGGRANAATGAAGSGAASGGVQYAIIKLRFDRRPVVGDKFSSRHGQKGVLSYLWPAADMPFTDRGMVPDVLINPHAFPSRMTIGMLVEMMAGKAGAVHGAFQDSTPFRFAESSGRRAVEHFGEQLAAAGFQYYGTETMYSGVTGEALGVDIFYGCVYYQRLRHMVGDKAQVRSTGPVNSLTRQPVKGRKKGGGVRFGEMERDALLAHGAAFLLHDRLHASSDRHIALVCKGCGSMLTPYTVPQAVGGGGGGGEAGEALGAAMDGGGPAGRRGARRAPHCASCGTGDHCVPIAMPYVFRYLANELAAMGVKLKLSVGEGRG